MEKQFIEDLKGFGMLAALGLFLVAINFLIPYI